MTKRIKDFSHRQRQIQNIYKQKLQKKKEPKNEEKRDIIIFIGVVMALGYLIAVYETFFH